jgi:hypothetical protein
MAQQQQQQYPPQQQPYPQQQQYAMPGYAPQPGSPQQQQQQQQYGSAYVAMPPDSGSAPPRDAKDSDDEDSSSSSEESEDSAEKRKRRKKKKKHSKRRREGTKDHVDDATEKKSILGGLLKNQWAIPYSDLVFESKLGKGAYGTVYRGEWNSTPVAIKQSNLVVASESDLEELRHEAELMMSLRPHPNVIQILFVAPIIVLPVKHYSNVTLN